MEAFKRTPQRHNPITSNRCLTDAYGPVGSVVNVEVAIQSSTTTITLQEWIDSAVKHRKGTRELVRLWMVNEFGCQKECANHLGVDKSTISRHVKALVKAGELEPSDSDLGA